MSYKEIREYIESRLAAGLPLHGEAREWAIDMMLDKEDKDNG